MGNPSKNPYSKSDSISYMVRDLPPGGRDQNNFSPFRLFRGNGSWCRISRIQSPSHHIISELKSSPPKPSEVSSKIFLPVIRKKPGCGRPVLPSASSEALGQEESSNPQRISEKNGRSGIRKRRHLSYTLWVGDGELGRHGRDHLSYLLAEESSNPRFRKNGRSGNQEKTASLLYPVGRGWRNAKKWASGNQEKTASLLYPWVGMEMSWTMHPEIISLGGIRKRRHLSYTLWVGDGELGRHGRDHLSYLLAEESSNPRFRKNGRSG